MSIKNNLRAGIGFLFLMALLSSGLSAYYLNRLSNESKAILRDNYDSLVFIENINEALDVPGIPNDSQLNIIESNIKNEEHNITEPGEKAFAYMQILSTLTKPCKKHSRLMGYGIK